MEFIPITSKPMNHTAAERDVESLIVEHESSLPDWAPKDALASFFHETMAPWNDTAEDVEAALEYLFSEAEGKGGFLTLMRVDGKLGGAVAMLETGMAGYVPSHILLFATIHPAARGGGLGTRLIQLALDHCPGDVKLHVEYDNPAKRLYKRLGFTSKYAELRYQQPAARSSDEGQAAEQLGQ
ncbi:MAG: ribosomal-protein-alanine N-acetyltransferase [Planctomycetota bacterium]|jgi:ribosomal-protein-alanine N-acetyltransferase